METKEKWSDMTKALKPVIDSCCLKPNELNDLIILLERGEKFKKMWKELRKDYESHDYVISVAEMDWIKKKYFPKEDY